MRKLFKTVLLAVAAATLGACGGGGGSPGDTSLPYTISLKADTTLLPINLANETPGFGNYSGIGAYARYTTVLHVQAMEGGKPIQDGEKMFACNLSGGLKSGALYYLDGKDEHMVEVDDGKGGKIKVPVAYRNITLDSNAGGASFHFHAGDEAGPVQIRCAVTNPADKQVSSAIVNITVGANTGQVASVVGTIQAPRYLGTQGNKQNLPTSVGVSVDVKDDANQPIPNSANANVEVSIIPFGASAGARLLSGSQQGSAVKVKTINGIGQFAVSSGPSSGVILLQLTGDRADNDVTNGIQDAVKQLRVVTVHQFVGGLSDLSIRDTELSVVNGMQYTFALTGEGGEPPYKWSSSALPAGLTLSADGILSGTVAAPSGDYNVQFAIEDALGVVVKKNIIIKVTGNFDIDGCDGDLTKACALPDWKGVPVPPAPGAAYLYTLSLSVGDPSVPVVWTYTPAPPPVTGLTFGADGVIQSIAPPTGATAGTYTFIVTATRGSIVIERPVKITVS
jgi:hypothetical protein